MSKINGTYAYEGLISCRPESTPGAADPCHTAVLFVRDVRECLVSSCAALIFICCVSSANCLDILPSGHPVLASSLITVQQTGCFLCRLTLHQGFFGSITQIFALTSTHPRDGRCTSFYIQLGTIFKSSVRWTPDLFFPDIMKPDVIIQLRFLLTSKNLAYLFWHI